MPSPTEWDVQAATGEPRAIIRVRNLQTTLGASAALDAWSRSGRAQPAVLSAEAVLVKPFAEAAVTDRVAGDTVHYGVLSKSLLASISKWSSLDTHGIMDFCSLQDVLRGLWRDLTGQQVADGLSTPAQAVTKAVPLTAEVVRRLTVTVLLPKASLVGEGASLTTTGLLAPQGGGEAIATHILRLHRLRVPTLVGVHAHERTAKQAVVMDVALDRYSGPRDIYTMLESFVVKLVGASSFETLEALGTHVARSILREFRPYGTLPGESLPEWYVHVALEKPIAVPFAEAPVVEVRMAAEHL
ncbi:hypothetical protein SEPCBS119000_001747 [Sporothrix epigloea]|uniref:Dihydroneopterin aldolase/epimerase domain-containing protein n=1 Tax=Sporothrix epigloea TaxID=1892477 RepID=A0ABP0DFM1_9PEZI